MRRPGFVSRPVHLNYLLEKVALRQTVRRLLRLFLTCASLQINIAVIRRTSGQSLRIFKQNDVLPNNRNRQTEKYFDCFICKDLKIFQFVSRSLIRVSLFINTFPTIHVYTKCTLNGCWRNRLERCG
jgi:hypothetical protein